MAINLNSFEIVDTKLKKGTLAHSKEQDGTYSIVYINPIDFSDQEYIVKNLTQAQAHSISRDLLEYLRNELPDSGVDYVRELKKRIREVGL